MYYGGSVCIRPSCAAFTVFVIYILGKTEAESSAQVLGRTATRTQSYSSVGQSATLIMWRSAVQVCLGLPRFYSRTPIHPGGLAQLARAPALQAGGHRFESDILHETAFMSTNFESRIDFDF
jgi:hypothetical protein